MTELKGELDKFTVVVGNFSTPISVSDKKIIKDREKLKNIINQPDLLDSYKTHTQQQQNTHFFKCTWNIDQGRQYPGW